MRGPVPEYEMRTAGSLGEALEMLGAGVVEWKPFAGGTDLMVLFESGKLAHRKFLNIWPLAELRGITVEDDAVTIGSLTTYTQIQKHPILRSEFPMLCEAARETGGIAIQNRGTIGGNIVNASPAADSPPALLAYDAELELVSSTGSRMLAYDGFHTGYKQMKIRNDELLQSVRLPRNKADWKHEFRKVGTRAAQAISKTCFAAAAKMNGDTIEEIRIAFGSVAPTVVRCHQTELALKSNRIDTALIEQARVALANEITPIDDIRSTARYRLRVSQNLLTDFLARLNA